VRLVLAAGVAVVVVGGLASVRIAQEGERDDRGPADAIVVLGAAQYDGTASPVFEARLEHAVALYHAGVARRFVVTGGRLAGDRTTEAAVARAYAIAHGVPAEAIFGEDLAHNTLDSLRAVAGEMRIRGLRSAIFVSDPTHMLRVLAIARDLGIESMASATRSSPVQADVLRRARATVHELAALAVYLVTRGTPPVEAPTG
jgi:uncharacterized SAM-binding protein YcdF (DUF218 family)